MKLAEWAEAIAVRLQEQATALSHNDICKGLQDCLNDSGGYGYICDIYGDDSDGDVVYYRNGQYAKAPYSMGMVNGKRTHQIDFEQAQNVLPRTVYDQEADDDDHVAGMSESERTEKYVERFPGSAKWDAKIWAFSERFISKDERDAADASDFAGKGKSFPILKPGDVMAAVRSIGRGVAGGQSAQALKNGIIRIAKKKGWTKYLPQSWQGGDSKESVDVELTGDVIVLKEGAVGQDGTAYLKLIAPGWGSSGYYSREVLQRDGPKIFKAGTKNFWDHQTAAEEAARPEGSLRDLASVLTEDARYDDQGPAGPGLYAHAKVFEQFRQPVDDLAKHIGVSIRANGRAREGKADGKSGPIIEQLTRGISADYVTTPGAGGKVMQLFEAARGRTPNTEGSPDMDEATVKRLISEATAPLIAENKRLKESLEANKPKRGKSIRRVIEALGVRLPEATLERVVKTVKANYPLTEAGDTDEKRLKEAVDAAVKEEAAYLEANTGRPVYLGAPATADPKLREAADKQWDAEFQEAMADMADEFLDHTEESDEKAVARRRKLFINGRAR